MTIHHQYRLGARALFTMAATALIAMMFSTVALAQSGHPDSESDQSLQDAPAAVEVSRAPYQEYRFTNCSVNEDCTVDFIKVPLSSRLEITNVSCFIEVSSTSTTTSPGIRAAQLLVLRANASVLTASTLLLEQQSFTSTGGTTTRGFAANHAVAVFANVNQRFQAYVDPLGASDRVSFMACHISGHMVKLG